MAKVVCAVTWHNGTSNTLLAVCDDGAVYAAEGWGNGQRWERVIPRIGAGDRASDDPNSPVARYWSEAASRAGQ